MAKGPQLYIKNGKGKYEPYKEPELPDNNIYCKIGNKYKPVGRLCNHDYLNEGIWAVVKHKCSKQICRTDSAKEMFDIEKICNSQEANLAQICDLLKYQNYVIQNIGDTNGLNLYDIVAKVIGLVFKYNINNKNT